MISRLTLGALLLLLVLSASCRGPVPPRPTPENEGSPFRISLSVSPFTGLILKNGVEFRRGETVAKTVEEVQRMFVAAGANEVYARIATHKKPLEATGDHSLGTGLSRGVLAAALQLPFNPEIGLFRVYGDVRCQPPPDFSEYPGIEVSSKAWTDLTLNEMLPHLQSYASLVARDILATGSTVNVWDLGNEVDFGVAGVSPQPMPGGCDSEEGAPGWYRPPDKIDPAIGQMDIVRLLTMPADERIAWLRDHVWPHEARIFAAVVEGIRTVVPDAQFSTHLSGVMAQRPAEAVAFFKAMQQGGYFPDELGFSFYPSSSEQPPDRLRVFRETIEAVRKEFNKPVFIAEFGYPAAPITVGFFASWNNAIPNYPISDEGQADLLRDLASWGKASGVSGIRPWAPDLPVPGWEPFALFSLKGTVAEARPSVGAILEGSKNPDPNALKLGPSAETPPSQ